jgi:hypothetical protein
MANTIEGKLTFDVSDLQALQKASQSAFSGLKDLADQIQKLGKGIGGDVTKVTKDYAVSLGDLTALAQRAGVQTGILGEATAALASPLGMAAAGFVALGLSVKAITSSLTEQFQQLRNLQAVSGLSADAAANLADTYTLLGFSSEHVMQAMFRLGAQMDANSNGLKLLGIAATDSAGKARPVGEVFLELRDRIAAMGDESSQSAALMSIFGRSALAELPIFQQTAAAFAQARATSAELSGSVKEAMAAAQEYTKSVGALSVAWRGFVNEVGPPVLSWLARITQGMANAVGESRRLREELAKPGREKSWLQSWWESVKHLFVGAPPPTLGPPSPTPEQARQSAGLPAPALGGLFPSIAQATAGLAGDITAVQQMATAMQSLDVALQAVKVNFDVGAIGIAAYRAALDQAARALEPLASKGIPEAQHALLALREAMQQLDVQQFHAQLDQRVQAVQRSTAQQVAVVKAQNAARLVSDEEAARGAAAIETAGAAEQLLILQQALANTKLNEFQKIALTKDVNDARLRLDLALLTERDVAERQATEAIKRNLALQLAAREAATDLTLAGLKRELDERRALLEGSSDDLATVAERVGAAELAVARQTFAATTALLDQRFDRAASDLKANLITENDFNAQVITLAKDRATAERTYDDELTRIRIANLKAYTDQTRTEVEAETAAWRQAVQEQKTLILATSASQITALRQTIDTLDVLIKEYSGNRGIQEGLITQKMIAESKLRILAAKGETDARITNDQQELQERVASLTLRNTAEQTATDLRLQLLGQEQRAIGDTAGFFKTQFALALTQANEFWASLTTLAQSTARNMTTAFSDLFFNIFTGNLKTIGDVFKSFLNSMLRAISDFLASSLVKEFASVALAALGGSGGGSATTGGLAAVIQGLSGGGAGTSGGAATGTPGATTSGGGLNVNLTSINPNTLQSLWSGVSNFSENWAGGGLSGALFGLSGGVGAVPIGGGALSTSASEAVVGSLGEGVSVGAVEAGAEGTAGFLGSAGTMSAAMAGLSTVVSVAAAAVAVFNAAMALANGEIGKGVGGLVGATAGGVIGGVIAAYFTAGIGTYAGVAIGAAIGEWLGELVGGLFGGRNDWIEKRVEAAKQANEAMGQLSASYSAAAKSGDITQVQAALSGTFGARGAVRSELTLPPELAAQLKITGDQINGQIRVAWADLTQEQFKAVLDTLKAQPDLMKGIIGSGDVAYLSQADAQAVADQAANGARALITAFQAIEDARHAIEDKFSGVQAAVSEFLPADAAAAFAENFLKPLEERLLQSLLTGGLSKEDMDKLAADFDNEMKLVQSIVAIGDDIAKIGGDMASQARVAGVTWKLTLAALSAAVDDTMAAVQAIPTTLPAFIQAAADARAAILARYQAEVEAVKTVETAISDLLKNIGVPLAELRRQIAAIDTATTGSLVGFADLAATLQGLAETSLSASIRLFAIQQGIATIIAALQSAVSYAVAHPTLAGPLSPANLQAPGAIAGFIVDASRPFLTQLEGLIKQAADAGDIQGAIGLLQQEQTAVKQLGQAAIQAVNDWATAAAKLVNDTADAAIKTVNDTADTLVTMVEQARDSQIAAIEATRDAQLAAIDEQTKALNAQIAGNQQLAGVIQSWLGAVQSAQGFVMSLKLGAGSPLTPAQQLALVRGQFQAAAGASATPEHLQALQAASQQYLQVAGQQMGTGSAGFKALVASVIATMERALAAAPGGGAVDALRASLTALQQQVQNLQDQKTALQDQAAAIRKSADDQITAIRETAADLIANVNAGRKLLIDNINIGRQHQLDGIEKTRLDTVTVIQTAVAAKLQRIADEQTKYMFQLVGERTTLLETITGGLSTTTFLAQEAKATVTLLGDIKQALLDNLTAGVMNRSTLATVATEGLPPGMPPGSPPLLPGGMSPWGESSLQPLGSFASGTDYVPRTGPYLLHEGERVRRAGAPASDTGPVTVTLELHAPVTLDGQVLTEAVLRQFKVRARAGAKDIPAELVFTRNRS